MKILSLYYNLFETDPNIFSIETTKQYTLAPLSSLMAEHIDAMSHERVLQSLKILNSDNI